MSASTDLAWAGKAANATPGIAIDVEADGHGPFSPDDRPGGDSAAANGLVRTHDLVTYSVAVNSPDGLSRDETFTLTAPADTHWNVLPAECKKGSSISATKLVCVVGDIAHETQTIGVTLAVDGTARHGQAVAVRGTVTAADSPDSKPVESPEVHVSAAPRYDLAKQAAVSLFKQDVPGPDGEMGMTMTYPVSVTFDPLVRGQGILGAERLGDRLAFVDDVSRLQGATASRAVLFADAPGGACRQNDSSIFSSLAAGRGGGDRAVPESGTISCSQDRPGAPVHVAVSGTDSSLSSVPSRGSGGQSLPADRFSVVEFAITVWFPLPDDPAATFTAVNTYEPLQTTSVSGQSNYAGDVEPLENNVASRVISESLPGQGFKNYAQVIDGRVTVGSGKAGSPYITPGTLARSHVALGNRGASAYRNSIICDVFDNSKQTIDKGPAGAYAVAGGQSGARVQYAASTYTSHQEARDSSCDDADGPWFSSPSAVPGGLAAVGKVRALSDVQGLSSLDLFTFLRIKPGQNGDRIRNFGQLHYGDHDGDEWHHDTTTADRAIGPLADSFILSQDLVRVAKKVVDPGTTAGTTPDLTNTVSVGGKITYAVYPSLTSQAIGAFTDTVTVTDRLPVGFSIDEKSASIRPTSVGTDEDTGREVVVWRLPKSAVNVPIAPITYDARVSGLASTGSAVNTVDVEASGDISDAALRQAERGVQITGGNGLGAQKTAVHPVVDIGAPLQWRLDYHNSKATPLAGSDVIDVLPWVGDGRGTDFHGRVALETAPEVDASAGESVTYTSARPSDISPDAGDVSNLPGGKTRWCGVGDFGDNGCPSDLADVSAFRIVRTSEIAAGGVVSHLVTLTGTGSRPDDRFVNSFGVRTASIALPTGSPPAAIRVEGDEGPGPTPTPTPDPTPDPTPEPGPGDVTGPEGPGSEAGPEPDTTEPSHGAMLAFTGGALPFVLGSVALAAVIAGLTLLWLRRRGDHGV